jgi:hypothetical protein
MIVYFFVHLKVLSQLKNAINYNTRKAIIQNGIHIEKYHEIN